MSTKEIKTKIKNKLDNENSWVANNPVLLSGELAISKESDGSLKLKVGDGTSSYNQISDYIASVAKLAPVSLSGSYNDLVNKPSIPSPYTLPTASSTVLGGVKVDGTSVTISNGVISSPEQTTISGNAGSATKLQNSRTISLTGSAEGSSSFDGSANIEIPVSIKKNVVTSTIGTTWVGSEAPYTQTITVNGVLTTSIISVSLPSTATKEQIEAFQALNWTDGGQTNNSITLKAWGDRNTIEVPIVITYENRNIDVPETPTEYATVTYINSLVGPLDTSVSNLTNNISSINSNITNINAEVDDLNTNITTKVSSSGNRGQLQGYETASTATGNITITSNSPDTTLLSTSGATTLTFTPAVASICAIKVLSLTATATTTLTISGASWANNGEAPTWGTAGKRLILVANFIAGVVILSVFDNNQ